MSAAENAYKMYSMSKMGGGGGPGMGSLMGMASKFL